MEKDTTEVIKEPWSITMGGGVTCCPTGAATDHNHLENIFDLHSYEEVKAVYDRIGAKQVETNYCYPRNSLFGLPNAYRTEDDYVFADEK